MIFFLLGAGSGSALAFVLKQRLCDSKFGTHQLQGVLDHMEDRVIACILPGVPGCFFAGVFNGHAGDAAAQFCAEQLHEVLAAKLSACEVADGAGHEEALADAFTELNDSFLEQSGDDTSGATACVVIRRGRRLYGANVGDSRCVLHRANGQGPCQLTFDHNPADASEAQRIEAAGGKLVDPGDGSGVRVCGPNNCTVHVARSIGDRHFKPMVCADPDTFEHPIVRGDYFVILASVGVWDVITDLSACEIVYSSLKWGASPAGAATVLCEAALDQGSQHNISAAVLVLDW